MSRINNCAIDNLSNSHFQHVEVITDTKVALKRQFMQFKVVEDEIKYIYP